MLATELQEDRLFMASLALAMVRQPRASLHDLAKSSGISKATLYRFCRTREQLHQRVLEHALEVVSSSIEEAQLESAAPVEALRRLTECTLEYRDLTVFLLHYWKYEGGGAQVQADWERAMDAFFLRGQQAGVFRVDIPAAALTEIYVGMLMGMIDAEHRGRVARVGLLGVIEAALLKGILVGA